jgi:hypothetical protein
MAEGVSAVAVLPALNTTTSFLFPAGEAVIDLIFNCYARNVTEANRIAATVKFMIERLGSIAVTVRATRSNPLPVAELLLLSNVPVPLRKGLGAETEQRIQADDVIYTDKSIQHH